MPKQVEVELYPEDGWTVPRIQDILKARTSVKEYAMILHDKDVDEDGKPIKDHYHLYLNFGRTNWQFKDVAKWFGIRPELVQKIKADKAFALLYHTHVNQPEKHQYSIDDIVANFDVKAFLQQKKQSASLDDLLRRCSNGEITRLNYTQYIDPVTFANHQRRIEAAWKYWESSQSNNGNREMSVMWLHGDTAVGKGLLCKLLAEDQNLPLYFTSTGEDPFGEYRGESLVVLDDLRPGKPFSFEALLKIIDPHNSCAVHSRYHNKYLRCTQIIVTSPMSPEQYAKQSYLKDEAAAQLYRRLFEVWEVTQSDICIRKYDLGLHSFVDVSHTPNPVPAYLATLPPSTPTINGSSALAHLNAKYAPSPVPVAPASGTGSSTPGGPTGTAADDEKEVLPF